MKIKYKIYIPSKGRVEQSFTADILKEYNVPYSIVVEPQDKDGYIEKFGEEIVIVMPENNQGIAYARNFIKNYSKQKNELCHWQIDDNIKSFRIRENNKNVKHNPYELIYNAETLTGRYKNIGIAGFRHTMFAFSATKEIDLNKQVYSCVLVNNSIDAKWRPDVVEDTDYSLQVLSLGFCTMLLNRLLIDKATTMKMKGGNTEIEYSGDGRMKRSLGLQKYWPNSFEITQEFGRVKVKPSRVWKSFTQKLIENES